MPDFGRSSYLSLKALQSMVKYDVIGFHGSSRLASRRLVSVSRSTVFSFVCSVRSPLPNSPTYPSRPPRQNIYKGVGALRSFWFFAMGSGKVLLPAAIRHIEGGGLDDIPPVEDFLPGWEKCWQTAKGDVKRTAADNRRRRNRSLLRWALAGAVVAGAVGAAVAYYRHRD